MARKLFLIYTFAVFVCLIVTIFYTIKKNSRNKSLPIYYPFSIDFVFTDGFGSFSDRNISSPTLQSISKWKKSDLSEEIVRVYWKIIKEESKIEFKIAFQMDFAEILIGFSDHGFLHQSDICLYNSLTNDLIDGWLDQELTLRRDIHDDCEMIEHGIGFFRFQRKFVTCDPKDFAFESGTANLFVALGINNVIRTLSPERKIPQQMQFTELFKRSEKLISPDYSQPELKTLDILAGNVSIPAQRTTYWCFILKLSEDIQRKKHHIIKYEAVITPGNEQLVHHFELFHCQSHTRQFRGDCSSDKPIEARSCSKVIAAWAMGANPLVYPEEAALEKVGMPFGGVDFVPFLMIEVHYNNEHELGDIIDNSGIRITYTGQLRLFDAGIIELGLIYSDANSIPPGQKAFPLTGFCTSECTAKFPQDGIKIFASQLHGHLTIRKQHIQRLKRSVRVLPGDVLATTCIYETQKKANWTWGGYGIDDEMCVNYIHYYPVSEVEVCKSAISNSSLNAFFAKLGIPKNGSLRIHEKYLSVKWTHAKIGLLHELYHVSPLNVACLNHSGQLFENHPTNWQKVDRPEMFQKTSKFIREEFPSTECFAINS